MGEQEENVEGAQVVGEVKEDVRKLLASLQQSANDIVRQIGELEVKKARLMGSLSDVEGRAQQVVNQEAERLGIEQGTQWTIQADGKAVLVG